MDVRGISFFSVVLAEVSTPLGMEALAKTIGLLKWSSDIINQTGNFVVSKDGSWFLGNSAKNDVNKVRQLTSVEGSGMTLAAHINILLDNLTAVLDNKEDLKKKITAYEANRTLNSKFDDGALEACTKMTIDPSVTDIKVYTDHSISNNNKESNMHRFSRRAIMIKDLSNYNESTKRTFKENVDNDDLWNKIVKIASSQNKSGKNNGVLTEDEIRKVLTQLAPVAKELIEMHTRLKDYKDTWTLTAYWKLYDQMTDDVQITLLQPPVNELLSAEGVYTGKVFQAFCVDIERGRVRQTLTSVLEALNAESAKRQQRKSKPGSPDVIGATSGQYSTMIARITTVISKLNEIITDRLNAEVKTNRSRFDTLKRDMDQLLNAFNSFVAAEGKDYSAQLNMNRYGTALAAVDVHGSHSKSKSLSTPAWAGRFGFGEMRGRSTVDVDANRPDDAGPAPGFLFRSRDDLLIRTLTADMEDMTGKIGAYDLQGQVRMLVVDNARKQWMDVTSGEGEDSHSATEMNQLSQRRRQVISSYISGMKYALRRFTQIHDKFAQTTHGDAMAYLRYWQRITPDATSVVDANKALKTLVVDGVNAPLSALMKVHSEGMDVFDTIDDKERQMLESVMTAIEHQIDRLENNVYRATPMSLAELVSDPKFLLLYAIKLLRIGYTWVSMHVAERVMVSWYTRQVYTRNEPPPHPAWFILLYMCFDAIFTSVIALVLIVMSRVSDDTVGSSVLFGFAVDYASTTAIMTLMHMTIAAIVYNKKYFRYKYEGERGIRALRQITFGTAVPIILVPFFASFTT